MYTLDRFYHRYRQLRFTGFIACDYKIFFIGRAQFLSSINDSTTGISDNFDTYCPFYITNLSLLIIKSNNVFEDYLFVIWNSKTITIIITLIPTSDHFWFFHYFLIFLKSSLTIVTLGFYLIYFMNGYVRIRDNCYFYLSSDDSWLINMF